MYSSDGELKISRLFYISLAHTVTDCYVTSKGCIGKLKSGRCTGQSNRQGCGCGHQSRHLHENVASAFVMDCG